MNMVEVQRVFRKLVEVSVMTQFSDVVANITFKEGWGLFGNATALHNGFETPVISRTQEKLIKIKF